MCIRDRDRMSMKRSWFSALIIVGVIGLLTLFLGLQYMWLTEVSEATRERMQKRVETDANRFAEDFDREMQAAYYNFQTPATVWKDSAWNAVSYTHLRAHETPEHL